MKPVFKLFAHLLFVAGMLVFYVLPANPYDWMQEFDPALSAETLEDPSGDNLIFTFLLLLGMAVMQAALIANSRGRLEKRVSVSLILIAAVFWAAKFWL